MMSLSWGRQGLKAGVLGLLVAVLLLLGMRPALADHGDHVRIGVLALRGKDAAVKMWSPMMAYLNRRVREYHFELVPLDYAELQEAARERKVEFMIVAAGQYVDLEMNYGATRIATVENTGPNGPFSAYGGVLVSKAGSPITRLEDLRGKTILIPDEASFGGWQMQWRELNAIGLEPGRDFTLRRSGNNEQTFLDLLSGKGDVAAARSDVLERMDRAGKLSQSAFQLIRSAQAPDTYSYWTSTRLYPEWPLARLRHTADDMAEKVLIGLFSLERNHPAAVAAEIHGWTVPRDYKPVDDLFKELRLGPYKNQTVHWGDLVKQHAVALLLAASALIFLFALQWWRVWGSHRRLAREMSERVRAESALRDERDRSASYLEIMGSIFVVLDSVGTILLANRRTNELLGYQEGELEGLNWIEACVPAGERETMRHVFADWINSRKEQMGVHENNVLTKDGRVRRIRWNNRLLLDERGRAISSICAGDDVTEQRASEAQVRLFAQVFEASAEGVTVCDAQARIVSINRAFTEITGYSLDEVRGKNPRVLSSGRQGPEFYREMWSRITLAGRWQGEIWNRRKTGELYPEWLSISALTNAMGDVTNYVGIFTDISRHKQDEARIHFLAYYDPLTNLPNRTLLGDRFEQTAAMAGRNGRSVALLFVDLDRFKQVNDSLGHQAGDALLQGVAERFGTCIRDSDTLARLGGDEFILLLPDVDSPEDAAAVAQKCIAVLKPVFDINGHELQVSPSIGIAMYPQDGHSLEALVKNADTAMYAAKDAGRATWRFFTGDMNARIFARMLLENQLRRAVERQEFVLHYQPQLNIATGKVHGVEALVRWNHPDQGLVFPGDFIAVAEDAGLIADIGRQVLDMACKQAAQWRAEGWPEMTMAVNVSAPQFRTENFMTTVQRALGNSGLPASCLELELTESILVENVEDTLALLREFKTLGVTLSVDDFGTGYSSLSYLKRFPVDRLKIDQSFVRGLIDDHDDRAIVASVIAMGKHLKLRVLAEGVESEEILAVLRAEGCDEYQGYLFSRPVPAERLKEVVFPVKG